MYTSRLEAFSDGVLAIIITIMVLEMKVPKGDDWEALADIIPVFLTYLGSFIYLGIYWNNHHHVMQAANKVNGKILWANLHLLFWLSLLPFATGWMGQNDFAEIPIALYGVVLLGAAIAFKIFIVVTVKAEGEDSVLSQVFSDDRKTTKSILIYLAAIALSFLWSPGSLILYLVVAVLWLIPDPRIESKLKEQGS